MSRRRTALGVLTAAVLAVPLTQVAGADEPTGQRAPATGEVGYALIQGKVVDVKTGKPIDDVQVQAVRQKEVKGITGASDLTYASPDNAIKHGYFAMHVPHGTYTVTFSKKDYAPVERVVRRKKEQQAGIGEVLLKLLPETRVSIGAVGRNRGSFTEGQDMVLQIQVKTKDKAKPTGTVTVYEGKAGGRQLATSGLTRADDGVVKLGLGKPERRPYIFLSVVYSGSDSLRSSETEMLRFTIRPDRDR